MNLKATIHSRYGVEVIDTDAEKERLLFERESISPRTEEERETMYSEYERRVAHLDAMPSFVESPRPELGELDGATPFYEEVDGVIVQRWEIVENDPQLVDLKIRELTQYLNNTDYKMKKCWEYSLVGLPLPYDPLLLHTDFQAKRDEINRLKNLSNQ